MLLKMNRQLNLTSTILLRDLKHLLDELITDAGVCASMHKTVLNCGVQPVRFDKDRGNRLRVASLDSTCITLAVAACRLTLAVRATVMLPRSGGGYLCVRTSPILKEFNIGSVESQTFPTQERVESLLRAALEACLVRRLIQEGLIDMIFVDGMLDEPFGGPLRDFKRKLALEALARGIDLVGFSKDSRVTPIVTLLREGYTMSDAPWFVYASKLSCVTVGAGSGVYVARLSGQGLTLRVDVVSRRDAGEVFADLLVSDRYYRGYPESLRLAHHLAVFTSLEALALKVAARRVESSLVELGGRRASILGSLRPSR